MKKLKNLGQMQIFFIVLAIAIFIAAGGIPMLIAQFMEENTFMVRHGTLVAALIAVGVGYYSIKAIRDQIAGDDRRFQQNKIDSALSLIHSVVHYDINYEEVLNLIKENKGAHGYIFPKAVLDIEDVETFLQINSMSSYAQLPPATLYQFTLIRAFVTSLHHRLVLLRGMPINEKGYVTVSVEAYNSIVENRDKSWKAIQDKLDKICEIYPELRFQE